MKEEDLIVNFVQRVTKKGIDPGAALSLAKNLEFEAMMNLLMKKGLLTRDEVSQEHKRLLRDMADKIEKMPPLPQSKQS